MGKYSIKAPKISMPKISGSIGQLGESIKKETKKAGKALQKAGDNPLVNVLTMGYAGTAGELSKGAKANLGRAFKNQMTGGLSGTGAKNSIQDIGKKTGDITDTSVKASDPTAVQKASTDLMNPLADQFQQYGNSTNITSNVDPAFRQYQLGLAQQLQQQAQGQGPSIAQMQLQQATDRTLNQSLGQIRAATGANAGLSARTAALAGAQQLATAGNASGQLRLQEQQQAQQALGQLAGQGRQGDLSAGGMDLQAQQANQAARLAAIQGQLGVRQSQVDTAENIYAIQNQAAMQSQQNKNNRNNQILGTLGTIAGTAVGTMYGGPVGGAAGGAAGGMVGNELGNLTGEELDERDRRNRQMNLAAQQQAAKFTA
jgi:hypothetical protein